MPKIAQNALFCEIQHHDIYLSQSLLFKTIPVRTNPLRSKQSLRFRASRGSKIEAGFVCQEFNIICCM